MADPWELVWRGTLVVGSPLLKLGFRLEGDLPELPEGPAVVAANHFSFVDPVMVGYALQRPVRYLAVAVLFDRHPAFTRLIDAYGAVPLRNEGVPLRAMRLALSHLEGGGTVGIFPEGQRVTDWGDQPGRRGAAWLAARTGAPLVPVFIHGSQWTLSHRQPRFRFVPVGLRFGEPIDPADYGTDVGAQWAMTWEWERRMTDLAADSPLRPRVL